MLKRDRGVERRRRALGVAERRDGKRDAVRDGEGGHGLQQHPAVLHDEQQPQHEQQVVGAEQDVPDALHDVGAHHFPPGLRGGDLDPRLRRAHDGRPFPAVQQLEADQHVGDGELQSSELDALAGQSFGPASIERRSTSESVSSCTAGSFRFFTSSGIFSTTGSRMPARTGVRQSTLNWPGAVSLISRYAGRDSWHAQRQQERGLRQAAKQ